MAGWGQLIHNTEASVFSLWVIYCAQSGRLNGLDAVIAGLLCGNNKAGLFFNSVRVRVCRWSVKPQL